MSKRPAVDLDAGWDDVPETVPPSEGSPPTSDGRRPTPWPSFDLAAFARDSETNLSALAALDKLPTAPPPPFHPASIQTGVGKSGQGVPGSGARLRSTVESISAPLRTRIVECTERTQLVRTQLRVGGLSREEAARALASELTTLETEAARGGSSIAQLTIALRTAIEELAGIAGLAPSVQFDVIVLDDRADTCARVALAVESLGHVARAATSLTELAILATRRIPDAIFVAATADDARQPEVCTLLREVVRSEHVAIVIYAATGAIEEIARIAGTKWWFRTDDEIEVMMREVESVFGSLLF